MSVTHIEEKEFLDVVKNGSNFLVDGIGYHRTRKGKIVLGYFRNYKGIIKK